MSWIEKIFKISTTKSKENIVQNDLKSRSEIEQEKGKVLLKSDVKQQLLKLDSSKKPYVKITGKRAKTLPFESKLGGYPYWPVSQDYPVDIQGKPMRLLAQINCSEIPHIDLFPNKGMLQFYISDNDGVYGLNFDDPTRQDFFRVIYFEEVNVHNPFVNDFSFIDEGEDFMPLNHEAKLNFVLDHQVVTTGDFQFEKIMGIDVMDFVDSAFENEEDAEKFYNDHACSGHRMGGYAYFTQSDPRSGKYNDYTMLLLQIDSDNDLGIMWGDCGVANFFIREDDLIRLDFTKVFYNWDCC